MDAYPSHPTRRKAWIHHLEHNLPLWLLAAPLLLLIVTPLLALILRVDLSHLLANLTDNVTLHAITLSLTTSFWRRSWP